MSHELKVLLDSLKEGNVVFFNGKVVVEMHHTMSDGAMWRAQACMLLDQDDMKALDKLVEGVNNMDPNEPDRGSEDERAEKFEEVRSNDRGFTEDEEPEQSDDESSDPDED